MKLKTSFLHKAFLRNDFKRYSWVAIAYALALFFVVPLKMVMIQSNQHIMGSHIYQDLFLLHGQIFQYILIWTVPVVLAMLLFRYLHVKIAADALHSLPVQRSSIYRSHILAGLVLLTAPVLLNGVIAIILSPVLNLGGYFSIGQVLGWIGITTLMNVTIFLACVFVGMLVGVSAAQGILTYILLLFPAGITILVTQNLELFVYGFNSNIGNELIRFSPMTRVMQGFKMDDLVMGGGEILAYVAVCLTLYFSANYLYKIRKLEAATQSIAFNKLHSVFKYGVTFCTMLLGGFYFYQTQNAWGWTIFGYVVGALVGYIVAQIILKKSLGFFKEVKSFRGLGVFGAVMLVLLLMIRFDVMGYEKRLPNLEAVEQIYFSDSLHGYNSASDYNQTAFYSKLDNLQHIHRLHQGIIRDKKHNFAFGRHNSIGRVFLVYRLNNGGTVSRGYQINYDDYARYLKPIYESQEYKAIHYDILHVNPEDVDKITLRPEIDTGAYKEVAISDPGEIKEAVSVMQQDVMQATYEQIMARKPSWASVSLLIASDKLEHYPKLRASLTRTPLETHREKNMHIYASWEKHGYLLENWLQEKGYEQNARILPEQISLAVVESVDNFEQWEEMRRWGIRAIPEQPGDKPVKYLEITDKNQIETCLRGYQNFWVLDDSFTPDVNKKERYIIHFYGQDQKFLQSGCFLGDQAPDFIKAYFAQYKVAAGAAASPKHAS